MRSRAGVVLLLTLAVLLPVGADLASPDGALPRSLKEWNARLHRWGVRLGILHCEFCERDAYFDLRGGSIPILSSR